MLKKFYWSYITFTWTRLSRILLNSFHFHDSIFRSLIFSNSSFSRSSFSRSSFKSLLKFFIFTISFHAYSNEEAPAPTPNILEQLFPFLLVGLFFYFLLIRPQQRRQKSQSDFLSKLQEGKEVLTTGGIYGKIVRVMGEYVLLEVSENTQIRVLKNCVSSYTQEKNPEKTTKKEDKKLKKIKT